MGMAPPPEYYKLDCPKCGKEARFIDRPGDQGEGYTWLFCKHCKMNKMDYQISDPRKYNLVFIGVRSQMNFGYPKGDEQHGVI
jgi:hypothetical protein